MIGMRETKTIGTWMEQLEAWNVTCECRNSQAMCDTCAGMIHPVACAVSRHISKLFDLRTPATNGKNSGDIFRAAFETHEHFVLINKHVRDLIAAESCTEETAGGTAEEVAIREQQDIVVILDAMRAIITRVQVIYPDLLDHEISTNVRESVEPS